MSRCCLRSISPLKSLVRASMARRVGRCQRLLVLTTDYLGVVSIPNLASRGVLALRWAQFLQALVIQGVLAVYLAAVRNSLTLPHQLLHHGVRFCSQVTSLLPHRSQVSASITSIHLLEPNRSIFSLLPSCNGWHSSHGLLLLPSLGIQHTSRYIHGSIQSVQRSNHVRIHVFIL